MVVRWHRTLLILVLSMAPSAMICAQETAGLFELGGSFWQVTAGLSPNALYGSMAPQDPTAAPAEGGAAATPETAGTAPTGTAPAEAGTATAPVVAGPPTKPVLARSPDPACANDRRPSSSAQAVSHGDWFRLQ